MTKVTSILIKPVFISSLPLLIGSSCFVVKELSTKGFQITLWQNSHDESEMSNGMTLNEMSFGVYSDLFVFLSSMLLLEIILRVVQKRIEFPLRTSLRETSESEEVKLFGVISENHIIRFLCYIGIFVILQLAGICLNFMQNEILNPHQPIITMEGSPSALKISETMPANSRILLQEYEEEEERTTVLTPVSISRTSDKISLSMGKILSSLDFDVSDMVLSKDRKIAFATIDFYGTLKIVDISDLQSPFVLSSLSLNLSGNLFHTKTLALSADESILYISNSRDIEIVDISNLRSPKLISFTESEVFDDVKKDNDDDDDGDVDKNMFMKIPKSFRTSLALDENTKTLYIGGIGLQIYDISNPQQPKLLKGFTNDVKTRRFTRNEISLSNDGKSLFIANGTLDIYNISDPKEMKLTRSISTGSSARSLFLSPEDSQTIFLLGASSDNSNLILEEVNISDYQVTETYQIDDSYAIHSRIITASSSRAKFFISIEDDDRNSHLLVYDSVKRAPLIKEKVLIEKTRTMVFSPDGGILITGSNDQFVIVELFLDYPNSRIFSRSSVNMVSNLSLAASCLKMELSKDGKSLLILRRDENDILSLKRIFEVWDIKDEKTPKLVGSYELFQEIKQMHPVGDLVYLVSDYKIFVLDISSKEKPNLIKTYKPDTNKKEQFLQIETSSDGKTGYIILFETGKRYVTFFNLQGEGFERLVTLDKELKSAECRLLRKDDNTLLIIDEEISIYDISDIRSPVEITSSLPIFTTEPEVRIVSNHISSDNKTLYIESSDRNGFVKLRIFNISEIKSPQLISEKYFSRFSRGVNKAKFSLFPDLKTGFIFQENYLVRVNLTDLKQPKVSGVVPLSTGRRGEVENYILSPDGERIYVVIDDKINILNMNIQYSLYLRKQNFLLGEKYSENIAILNLTDGRSRDYDAVNTDDYRIMKLSLLDVRIAPNRENLEMKTLLLPSWITFDKQNNLLTMEPKRQSDLGTYTFRSAFSLKIPMDAFSGLNLTDGIESEDLLAWLISLDFVDNQLFLTENFGSLETFFLPTKFKKYKTEVYNILKKFYFETCTMFEILPSLEFKENDMKISSLSSDNIKVEIKVEGSEAKFVNIPYGSLLPSVRENKTKVVLEGTIAEINTALQSVVVNSENEEVKNASINIIDGLNPQMTREVINISKYFKANEAPTQNSKTGKTVQEHINNAGFQTGSYLSLTLGQDTFKDKHSDSLSYDLVMARNSSDLLPTWLSYSGLTLKGTPPEEIFGRDYDMVFVARNEFKESRVPFKLHVKISSSFIVKLFLKYSSYILTVVGLWVSANKLYNILGKPLYKHPKEFKIGTGEEVSPSVIFPISFIQEERKQSEIIWKHFGELRLADFVDTTKQTLNKQRIIDKIQGTVKAMPSSDKEKITKYHPNCVIDQIIINKFTFMQLGSDKKTRSLFEEVKANCLDVIEIDTSLPLGFTVNQEKLNKLLSTRSDETKYSSEDLEESLIPSGIPGEVNMSLLKDAILAFAFEKHSLDISPVQTEISVKQKVPTRFLFKFLKLDLKDISLSGMDYGINYRIKNDKLSFSGIAQDYLKGKTIVVQIKTRRQRIMKEIWMHGVDKKEGEISVFRDEQEARGKGYEIF